MFINFPHNSTCQTIRIHPSVRSNNPKGLVFHCSTTYHISYMSMESDYRNDVRHTDKFEDYWQTFNIASNLAKSSIPPPKANNTNNTKQNRTTNQKPMTKSYPTLPKWNITPESKGWSRFTNIVPGLWLLVSGRWKNLTTSPKLIQNDLKRYSLITGGQSTTTIGFDSGSCSFHPPMKPPWRAAVVARNMRSSDAMEISMNSSSISTAKSWRQFSAENLVVARVVQGL